MTVQNLITICLKFNTLKIFQKKLLRLNIFLQNMHRRLVQTSTRGIKSMWGHNSASNT